jgi:hypothetical protein
MNVLGSIRRLRIYSSVQEPRNISPLHSSVLRNIKEPRNVHYFTVVLVEEQTRLSWTPAMRIYTISKIVFHVVLILINNEGHFVSMSSYDINQQWWLIQHIDAIVGFGNSKKSMIDPTVMRTNNFKDDCRMFDVPCINWPCEPTVQLCHCQCIQSMLPNIPGNPRSSALASKRWVSAIVKWCKNSAPKHSMLSA